MYSSSVKLEAADRKRLYDATDKVKVIEYAETHSKRGREKIIFVGE